MFQNGDPVSFPVKEAHDVDGKDENPVLTTRGIAGLDNTYDSIGNVLSESYVGTDGGPVSLADGYHTVRYTYDDEKHRLTTRYFDEEENPVLTTLKIAGIDNE